jgi:hypothetical protein
MANLQGMTISFTNLIESYKKLQMGLVSQVRALASKSSSANAASFILLQFQMSQVTQIGESISNLISQVNKVISNAISNQKTN